MANTISAQTGPQTTAEYEAEFEMLMQEAARLNELMASDRIEIERLKAETKVIRDETRNMLTSMGEVVAAKEPCVKTHGYTAQTP